MIDKKRDELMTAEHSRRSKLDHIAESAARGIIDEPEILVPPYDEAGNLTEAGEAWLGRDHADDEQGPAEAAARRRMTSQDAK